MFGISPCTLKMEKQLSTSLDETDRTAFDASMDTSLVEHTSTGTEHTDVESDIVECAWGFAGVAFAELEGVVVVVAYSVESA